MSNKRNIKNYFSAPSSITQPSVEPSNESAGCTSTSPPNEKTNDKQHPTLSESQPYHPDSSFVFPETVFGKQNRSCKHDWFKRFPWLDYDAFNDSVTCYVCKRQNNQDNLKTERCKENAFLEKGFKNWKKAIEKFEKHQSSQCHRAASTYDQSFMPISPSLIQLIWLRSQMNSRRNAIPENVFSGSFKMT